MLSKILSNKVMIESDAQSSSAVAQGFPKHVTLIITNVCQLRCRFCRMNHDGKGKFIHPETVLSMHWLQYAETICISGSGEALVHPRYTEIIKNIRTVAPHANITLYTNGVALFGKNLDATLKYCDGIHISVNSIVKETHKKIVYKDKYDILMKNLITLSRTKPRTFRVKLSFVLLKETIDEVYKNINFASHLGFQTVAFLSANMPMTFFEHSLGQDSFMYEDMDKNTLLAYGASKNIHVEYRPRTDVSCRGICKEPWSYLMIYINWEGDIALHLCCSGSPNVFIKEEDLPNIDIIWNNERFQLIRATVNDDEKLIINKLCLLCRLKRLHPIEKHKSMYENMNIHLNQDSGSYEYFGKMSL